MKKIVIEVDEFGYGKILVDGRDISSSAHAVNVKIRPGNLCQIFVMMHGEAQMSMLAEMEERRV